MAKQTFTTGQVLTAAQMTSLQQTAMGGGAATAKTASYVLTAADAGTVVQMNAAGATTITVNTALFSAGDSVQIQNIGAGVCTVTAGTATVTTAGSLALSQWEGGNLYFTSTSASIFFDIVQSSGMTNPMTTTGDTIYSSSGSTPARLGIGSTGQVLTVAAGIPSWATPSSGASFAGVACTTNANQSIGDSAYVVLNFNQEYLDVGGYHDTATNNSRLTVPSGKAGYYQAYFNINFAGNATNGAAGRRAFIMLNGSVAALVNNQSDVSTTLIKGLTASRTFNLAVGDYLEVAVYQTSGGALNVLGGDAYCTFGMFYLGA